MLKKEGEHTNELSNCHTLDDRCIGILLKTKLFESIDADGIREVLSCTGARMASYGKNATMITEQSEIKDIGVILSGHAYAYKQDLSGRRIIIAHHVSGSVFGDVLSASANQKSPVAVTAAESVSAILIPFEKVVRRCAKSCERHERLLLNLLNILSCKYFELHERMNCIIRPTLREKILFYLKGASEKSGDAFTIPFDRAALAEYLNADRSALSRELSAMKKEGLIDYYKNSFCLLGADISSEQE